MKIFSIAILLTMSLLGWSQNQLKIGLYGGPDFSLLQPTSDSIAVESLVSPFFGLELLYPVSGNNHIRFGTSYFVKASKSLKNIKYKNSFISIYANYHYAISDNFFVTLGPQYSILLNAYSQSGSVKNDISGYNSYFSINGGVDVQLQSHLNLGIIYEYPINNPKLATWPSIKIKLNLIIDKDLFKVKEKHQTAHLGKQKIKSLKASALLVRLRGYRKQISAYEAKNDSVMVKLMKRKRDEANRSIIQAFESEFDFCPVYFFYNYDTKKIKDRDFSNVFLNNKLEKDETIKFDLDTFLIGELGYTQTDTTVTYGQNDVYKNGVNMADGFSETATVESDISHYGFSIRNQDFVFKDKPFPSFTSGYYAFIKRSNKSLITKLNKRLHRYYMDNRQ